VRNPLIYLAAAIFALALVRRFHELGGPYFAAPVTIQDHVSRVPFPSRDVIVMAGRAAKLLPRGATVTVFPKDDPTLYRTAVGFMPHHKIVAPDLEAKPQYVIAVREPLGAPSYRLIAEFAEGKIYARR
jgi:hypothetical protein